MLTKTRPEQYQEKLEIMGYSTALSYALSIVIFNTNSYVNPKEMSKEKLVKEVEYATEYLKNQLDKSLVRVKGIGQ